MGSLIDIASGRPTELLPITRVGRNPDRDLVLEGWPRASGEHATVRWSSGQWELVDQGSRNGTWVGERRAQPGVPVPLCIGSEIVFGTGGPVFRLVDDTVPQPRAIGATQVLRAWNGVLAIPCGADMILVHPAERGGWVMEAAEGGRPVLDRAELQVGGDCWVLSLPDGAIGTELPRSAGRLAASELRFRAHEGGDRVSLHVVEPSGAGVDLGCYAHHRVLWALAFLRLQARRRGLDEHSEGWVTPTRLAAQLEAASPRYVYLKLFKARAQIRAAGFDDADDVVERDPVGGRIRIGVPRLSIEDS